MNELIGIVAAAIFYIALGMFWYSPAVFWKVWMKAKWFLHEDMENKKMPKHAFCKAILNAFFAAVLMTLAWMQFMFESIESYLTFAFIATLFVTTNEISKHIWEQEKFKLAVLNTFYTLFAYLGMATIIFYI